jgi:hypothetical protein
MQKELVKMQDVIGAKLAIDRILTMPGLPYKKAYWLDRNRKSMAGPLKKWQEHHHEIFEKYSIDIPNFPFVPIDRYKELKAAVMKIDFASENALDKLKSTFETFEVAGADSEAKKGVPPTKVKQYQEEVNAEMIKLEVEIEFTEIELDPVIEQILSQIPGELQLAMSFMLKEMSNIQVFPGGLMQ